MRVPAALVALIISVPATAAGPDRSAANDQAANCPHTTGYLADRSGLYRGKPLGPRTLTELPPATAYMAVLRHIGGCEAPLAMVDYRNPRRR